VRTKEYDLIVLGTGDAGQAVALAAAKEKWKVAIVEKKAIGGTCALWGCVPKKVLISGEELVNFSQRMAEAGLSSKTTPDWSELMAFKHRLTGSFSKDSRSRLQKHGIDIYEGTASFVDEAAIRVGEVILQGGHIHIATGACPRPLRIPGEEFMTTSSEFLYLGGVAKRLVFIGGGISHLNLHIWLPATAATLPSFTAAQGCLRNLIRTWSHYWWHRRTWNHGGVSTSSRIEKKG
jgi:glutathione reductase (NADPH)